jgi:hypothetical protein
MKNDLLNKKLLEQYEDKFTLNVKKHDLLKEYIKKVEKEEFKDEVANYINFYEYILRGTLGYKPDDLTFEGKVDDTSQRVEFALKSNDKKFMVIELKGQGTDLDKPQKGRQDPRSPMDQALGYAFHIGTAEWILLSDYDEFRLYNYHEKTKYISFNARELTDKKIFKWFMLAFSKESHEKGYLEKISKQTQIIERKLENEFYKLYHETRLMIIKELEEIKGFKRDDTVHYAQLILNRYMFICFAEDLGLLPPQILVQTINNSIKSKTVKRNSIWHDLNDLFMDINEGDTNRGIFPYNGGLFREEFNQDIGIRDLVEDPDFFKETYQGWLFNENGLDIKDLLAPYGNTINPIYKNLLTISSFDFRSDLDVNIMGHIFENSIGDLEDLKEDKKGRKKGEGIYYTPNYITDYICRNTIIPYLSKSGKPNTIEDLLEEYLGSEIDELDQKLKDIKIVDPACGSGAFLNKAADVLLDIHQAIHNRKYSGKNTLDKHFDSVEERRSILLDNIYGVDLNEESVEITKLALFLNIFKRTVNEKEKAKPMQLPNIDNNIKCGNSLIDDPEYTNKPFNWEKEFKTIFDDVGFDVVIGNPPYVRQEKIKKIKPYLKENYEVYTGTSDLYVYFFEKGLKILNDEGMFAFICANKFTRTKNDKPLREFILRHKFLKYVDYTGQNVFEEVTTNPCVVVIKNEAYNNLNSILVNDDFVLEQGRFDGGIWSFYHPSVLGLTDKISQKGILIKKMPNIKIFYGIKTGFDKSFIIDERTKSELINKDKKNKELIKPFVRGRDIKRYKLNFSGLYIILTKIDVQIENYPVIKQYLNKFKENLKRRYDQGNHWWELRKCNYYDEFEKEKIIWGNLSIGPNFGYSENELYITAPANMMTGKNIKYILSILNSNLTNFYFRSIGAMVDSGYVEWKKNRIEQLPIYPASAEQQKPFVEKANQMLMLNKELMDEINGFKEWVKTTFGVDKISKKLDKYYELDFTDFLDELKKKKVDTSSRKTQELLKKEFKNSLEKIEPLQVEIRKTDKEIDQMVYRLYDLTAEETRIIENSLD